MKQLFHLAGLGIWLGALCFCSTLWGSVITHAIAWLILFEFATFSLVLFILLFFMIKPLVK